MKRFVLENKNVFNLNQVKEDDKTKKNLKIDKNSFIRNNDFKKSIIDAIKLSELEIEQVEIALQKLTDYSFQPFDFNQIYSIIDKHFMSMITNPKSNSLIAFFRKKGELDKQEIRQYNEELKNRGLLKSLSGKKFLKLIMQYQNDKNNFLESSLIQNLSDLHVDYDVNYRNLLIKFLFFSLNRKSGQNVYEIFSKDTYAIILKLLQFDTAKVQTEIQKLYEDKPYQIGLEHLTDTFFINLLGVILSSYNSSISFNDDYYLACNIIKIFKYLCEEHNNFFQNIFLKKINFDYYNVTNGKKGNISFFDLMLTILNKILSLSGWDKVINSNNDCYYSDYFYDLFSCIIELLIEIIQGTDTRNFSNILDTENKNIKILQDYEVERLKIFKSKKSLNFYTNLICEDNKTKSLTVFLNNIKPILMNDQSSSETLINVKNELANFLLAFLEEKKCPNNIKLLIINSFSPQGVLNIMCKTLKHLYIKLMDTGKNKNGRVQKKTNYTLNTTISTKNFFENVYGHYTKMKTEKTEGKKIKIIFDEKLYSYYVYKYFEDEEFSQCPEFLFTNTLFRYFKLIGLEHENEEAKKILDKVKTADESHLLEYYTRRKKQFTSNTNIEPFSNKMKDELRQDEHFFENYFTIKLFEAITRTIHVQEGNSDTRVIFNLPPKINFLSKHTKEEFVNNVNRDNRHSKLLSLIEHSEYFKLEIIYNHHKSKESRFFKLINKLSFFTLGYLSYLYIAFINLYMVIYFDNDLKEYPYVPAETCDGDIDSRLLLNINNDTNITSSINQTIISNLERKSTDPLSNTSTILAALELSLNLIFLILWIITKLPLSLKIESNKFFNNRLIIEEKLTRVKKFKLLFFAFLSRNTTIIFIWNIIFALILLFNPQLQFFFPAQLLIIAYISATLRIILKAVTLRFRQLISTFFLLIVVQICYASIAFFYFPEKFYLEEIKENACDSFGKCILALMLYGLLAHGGIGQTLAQESYLNSKAFYFGILFFNLLYFIIIVVLLLNVVFGIIIDTFRELRVKYQEDLHDKLNRCFICGEERDNLEKDGNNFENHVIIDHDLWNYAYYIIALKFTDVQDMNYINSYVAGCIEEKDISWIPCRKELEDCGLNNNTKIEKTDYKYSRITKNTNLKNSKYSKSKKGTKIGSKILQQKEMLKVLFKEIDQ